MTNGLDGSISKSIDGVREGLSEVGRALVKPEGVINDHVKVQFDYAWKWFDFHAKQRTSMFNFYIIVVAAVFGAIGALLREPNNANIIVIFCIFGIVISIIFYGFDRRNIRLLTYGEITLIWLEKNKLFTTETEDVLFDGKMRHIGLLKQEYYRQGNEETEDSKFFGKPKIISHSKLMAITYFVVIIALGFLAMFVKCKFKS